MKGGIWNCLSRGNGIKVSLISLGELLRVVLVSSLVM